MPKLVNSVLITVTIMLNLINKVMLILLLPTHHMTTGYCVKCRTKREIQGATAVTLKNGKPATKGTCPECSTKMFRIGKS